MDCLPTACEWPINSTETLRLPIPIRLPSGWQSGGKRRAAVYCQLFIVFLACPFLCVAFLEPRPEMGSGQPHVAKVVLNDEFRDRVDVGLGVHAMAQVLLKLVFI